jgi:hypothetical protein
MLIMVVPFVCGSALMTATLLKNLSAAASFSTLQTERTTDMAFWSARSPATLIT